MVKFARSFITDFVGSVSPWEPGNEVKEFSVGEKIYCWVRLEELTKPHNVKFEWFFDGVKSSEWKTDTSDPASAGFSVWDWYHVFAWVLPSKPCSVKVRIYLDGVVKAEHSAEYGAKETGFTGEILVTVKSDESRLPLSKASVLLIPGKTIVTGSDGIADFKGLAPDTYHVNVSLTGFIVQERVIQLSEGQLTKQTFFLKALPPPVSAKPSAENVFNLFSLALLNPIDLSAGLDKLRAGLADNVNAALASVGLPSLSDLSQFLSGPTGTILLGSIGVITDIPAIVELMGASEASALSDSMVNKAAGEIQELGLSKPKTLFSEVKALNSTERSVLYGKLNSTPAGRKAIETIQRVWLDNKYPILVNILVKHPIAAISGIIGFTSAYSFLGFPFEEGDQRVLGALNDAVYAKDWNTAAKNLPLLEKIMQTIKANTDTLRAVPVFGSILNFIWGPELDAAQANFKALKYKVAQGLEAQAKGTTISVSTDPTGALCSIPSVFIQKIAPFTASIAPGTYELTIEKEGYEPQTIKVYPKKNEDTKVSIALNPLPETITKGSGRLSLAVFEKTTGNPIKATLYVDGAQEQYHLHSYAMDLKPSAYELRVEEPGYKVWEDTISITEKETTTITVKLEAIEVPPSEEYKGVTCETLGYLSAPPETGEYELIPVKGLLCYQLKIKTTGFLEVNSSPTAEIWIAGKKQAEKTPARIELEQGVYSIKLTAEGYADKTSTTIIRAGETTALSVDLSALKEAPALQSLYKVSIDSDPSSAKILVNGSFTEKYTPDFVLLLPGEYEIALTKSGYDRWSTAISLAELV